MFTPIVGDYIPYDSTVVQEMLSYLKYGTRKPTEPWDWYSLGEEGYLGTSACGDFGYISDSGEFMNLGNIMNLVSNDPRHLDGVVEMQYYSFPNCEDKVIDRLPQRIQYVCPRCDCGGSVELLTVCNQN